MSALPASVERALHAELRAGRSLAWLHVDPSLRLAGCGGLLAHYGLDCLRIGESASQQVVFLEGFLPLAESPTLIRSVELAANCAADLHLRVHDGHTWIVLLDVTAERNEARQVQQKAYEMTLLEEKEARLNRRLEAANAALVRARGEIEASRAALQRVHDRLSLELKEAAAYVRSILPPPMASPFAIDWRFVPSAALGGDCFGYHWIDDGHFSLYLLDVCGHGIGPSLMSVGVLNTLRSGSLPQVDLRDPEQVMAGLNRIYRMQAHNDLFFTIWYGVYAPATRRLDYSAAGHPPALLVQTGMQADAGATPTRLLGTRGRPIGTTTDAPWYSESITVPARSALYLLSDGAFEVFRNDGSMLPFDEFVAFIESLDRCGDGERDAPLDRLLDYLHGQGPGSEADDLSIVRFDF